MPFGHGPMGGFGSHAAAVPGGMGPMMPPMMGSSMMGMDPTDVNRGGNNGVVLLVSNLPDDVRFPLF